VFADPEVGSLHLEFGKGIETEEWHAVVSTRKKWLSIRNKVAD
jgi:hypothetical protein